MWSRQQYQNIKWIGNREARDLEDASEKGTWVLSKRIWSMERVGVYD